MGIAFNYQGLTENLRHISESLQGVTGQFYNAILSFETGDGDLIIDPNTGNYTMSKSTTTEIRAKLLQKKDPNFIENVGVDQLMTYLEGWLICPVEFDGTIPETVNCKLKQNNLWQEGKFTIIDKIPTNVNEEIDIAVGVGQRVCGYYSRFESETL